MKVRSNMFTQSHWKKKIKRTKNLTAKEEPKAKEKCKLMRGSATKKGGERNVNLKRQRYGKEESM